MPGPERTNPNLRIGLRCMGTWVVVLAMVTACADSSGPAVSGSIVEGQPLRLEVPSAVLHVPAGALSEGVEVRLTKKPLDQFEEQPETNEVPVTEVVTIEFSKAERTNDILVVEINLPDAADGDLYGLIKSTGSRFPHGITDTDWSLALGVLDEERSVLRFQLFSSATSVSLVVVRDPETSSSMAAPPVNSLRAATHGLGRFAMNLIGSEQAHAQDEISDFGTPLNGVGWAVTCRRGRFKGKWSGQCNSDSEDFKQMAIWALQSSKTLIGLGLDQVILRRWSQTEIEKRRKRNRPFVTVEPTFLPSFSEEYFLIEVDPLFDRNYKVKANAEYDPDKGTIIVKPWIKEGTVIHELMHAVQAVEIPIVGWDHEWITEGIASATEPFAADLYGPSIPSARDYRYSGVWRDWYYPLSSEDFAGIPYQVSEFWLSIDPTLKYLSEAYPVIQSRATTYKIQPSGSPKLSEFPTKFQYDVVDYALQSAVKKSIEDVYLDLLATRNDQEPYQKYCTNVQMNCDGDKCRLSEETELRQEKAKLPTAAMSAQCYNVLTKFDVKCANPSIQLDLQGDKRAHRFLVKGDRHSVDKTVILRPRDYKPDFKLWVANVDSHATPDLSASDVIVSPLCGSAKVLRIMQSILTHASAVSSTSMIDPVMENYQREYTWDPVLGNNETRTWSFNGGDVNVKEAPLNSANQLELTHQVNLSQGASAHAQMTTTTTDDERGLVVEGRVRIEANGSGGGSWLLSASAKASWMLSVSVQSPSKIQITNCALFDQDLLADYGIVKSGANCSFRTAGSQTMHMPSVAGLPGISEDFRYPLAEEGDLGEEGRSNPVNIGATDKLLKQAKKIETELSGAIFIFSINADRFESTHGADGREVNQSFTLRISPDVGEELPSPNVEEELLSKKDRGTSLKVLAKHLPTHGNNSVRN